MANISEEPPLRRARGFTLTELAVVLLIVTLLITGMLVPLSAQDELRRSSDTKKTLRDIQDALLGFAVSRDRLPCPAVDAATGTESFTGTVGASTCTVTEGFVPAITLGISPTDGQGYAVDAWDQRIRYAITKQNGGGYSFANTNGMKAIGLSGLAPDLRICTSSTCTVTLASNAVAVLWSIGKNGSDLSKGGVGADEQDNPNLNSPTFPDTNPERYVSHEQTGDFDDLVIWLSPNILYNRMIAAGRLP